MKKLFLVCLVVLALAACSSDESTGPDPTQKAQTAVASENAARATTDAQLRRDATQMAGQLYDYDATFAAQDVQIGMLQATATALVETMPNPTEIAQRVATQVAATKPTPQPVAAEVQADPCSMPVSQMRTLLDQLQASLNNADIQFAQNTIAQNLTQLDLAAGQCYERTQIQSAPVPGRQRPYLGVFRDVTWNEEMERKVVWIKDVVANDPADVARLLKDDQILALNGEEVTPETYPDIFLKYRPGDMVTFTIWRTGVTLDLPVTLGTDRRRIVLIDAMSGWDGLYYTRLQEIAALKNIDLLLSTGDDAQTRLSAWDYLYVDAFIVFGGSFSYKRGHGGTSSGQLADLRQFVDQGGRFVYFALPLMSDFNNDLSGLFHLTVGWEPVTPYGPDLLSVSGGALTPLWQGLEVGSQLAYPLLPLDFDQGVTISTYFGVLDPNQIWTAIDNQDGTSRKLSVYGQLGGGEYLFVSNFNTGGAGNTVRNLANPLHDGNIDAWDNAEAASRLLDWLVGDLPYGTVSTTADAAPGGVTDEHIQRVFDIQTQLASGEITSEEAQQNLEAVALETGRDGLIWILRHVPIYDTETQQWQSFGSYATDLASESGIPEDSPLAQDPVGIGVDLFLGNYDVDDIQTWLGIEN